VETTSTRASVANTKTTADTVNTHTTTAADSGIYGAHSRARIVNSISESRIPASLTSATIVSIPSGDGSIARKTKSIVRKNEPFRQQFWAAEQEKDRLQLENDPWQQSVVLQ
jgi:hypothetical protein